jgi:hypothetical protein
MSVQKLVPLPLKRVSEKLKSSHIRNFNANHSAQIINLLDYANNKRRNNALLDAHDSYPWAGRLIGIVAGLVIVCGLVAVMHFL